MAKELENATASQEKEVILEEPGEKTLSSYYSGSKIRITATSAVCSYWF